MIGGDASGFIGITTLMRSLTSAAHRKESRMSHRVALRKRKNYSRLAPRLAGSVIVLSLFAAATSAIARNNENHHVRIVTLSPRPDTVRGGHVLAELDGPRRGT